MRIKSLRAVAALALAFGILGSSNSGAVRPVPVAESDSLVTPVWTPLASLPRTGLSACITLKPPVGFFEFNSH